jgi:agmatinase
MNFGGIYPVCSLKEALFVIVPVPYDLTSTYQPGSRRGPVAIIEASTNMELYDDELKKETYSTGIHTTMPLKVDSRGPKHMTSVVRRKISRLAALNKIPVILGGEHSISFGVVQAMKDKYPKLKVLQLDAHADLRNSYQKSPYSHASVARRISEICSLVQVGIRSLSKEEADFLPGSNIKSYSADFVSENKKWCETICKDLSGDVFISIDLDVFDPSIMPATGTPEPGGLYWKDILYLLRNISRSCKIRGFDVVELAPIPGLIAPDFMAAKLIYRLMGYITE